MDTALATSVSADADTWAKAFLAWQSGLAENTQRCYRMAWQDLLSFAEAMPWTITRGDVARWVEGMRTRGNAAATIRQRVAAISSFYRYAGLDYTVRRDDREEPLYDGTNPAGSRLLRPRKAAYQNATYLGKDACRALLREIRITTGPKGERDFALILGYLVMGRRNSEIRLLKWGDLETTDGKTWYRWSGKGHKDMRMELPEVCAEAIRSYLKLAGRLETMQAGDYIFTAIGTSAERLPENKPLSSRMVGKLLKKYALAAGMDPQQVHVHTLRHSAAMLRKSVGDSVEDIQAFLVHSSLNVTQGYLHTLTGQGDGSWMKVADLLGLGASEHEATIPPEKRRHHKRR